MNHNRNTRLLQALNTSGSTSEDHKQSSEANYSTDSPLDSSQQKAYGERSLGYDLVVERKFSPLSPSEASSRPSMDPDVDSDEDSSTDSTDSDDESPSLQMMSESHQRNQKAKESQSHLGVPIPTTRPRILSDPLAFVAGPDEAEPTDSSHDKSSDAPANPTALACSPAMQFLAGLNSPFSLPKTLTPIHTIGSSKPSTRAPPRVEERVGPYVLGEVIGRGGFSVIRKGTSPSGVVAIKSIPRQIHTEANDPDPVISVEQEISIWSSLHHEYILPLFSDYRTDEHIYIVTLYCPAGSLFDILRLHGAPGLPQDDAGTMFRQIVRGLRYLHEQALLVHGDIKLENILVDELGACRIADFGLSRHIPRTRSPESYESSTPQLALPPHLASKAPRHRNSTHVPGAETPLSLHHFPPGSLPYAAPELLLPPRRMDGTPESHRPYVPNPAQDIWALGCVLHALLFGRLPFVDTYEPRLQMKIVRGVWERGRSRSVSRARGSRSKSRVRSASREARAGAKLHHFTKPRGTSKSPSKEVQVGNGARKVLRGCICVDISNRWTARQVDEVAWNVGWDDIKEVPDGEINSEHDHIVGNPMSQTTISRSTTVQNLSKEENRNTDWHTDNDDDPVTSLGFFPARRSRSRRQLSLQD
ncbi:kinase-like protein [Serendipita vermifera]|nr:kinase-like protein [Serendipita vermifera]